MIYYNFWTLNLRDPKILASIIAEMKILNLSPFRFLTYTRIKLCFFYFDAFNFECTLEQKTTIIFNFPILPLYPNRLDISKEYQHYSRVIPKCNLILFFVDSFNIQRDLDQLKQWDGLKTWEKNSPLLIIVFYNLGQENQTNLSILRESFSNVHYNHFIISDFLQYHEIGFVKDLFTSIRNSISLIPTQFLLKLQEKFSI